MYNVIVIGAGVGGLATALRLRHRGLKVLVLEKNDYVGGKMNQYESNGYRWDTGPSLFTMPHLVDELYTLYDKDPKDYYQYHREEESCRYFFNDSSQITFYDDQNRLDQELAQELGVKDDRVSTYLKKSASKYNAIGEMFLETPIHKASYLPVGMLLRKTPLLLQTELMSTLHSVNQKHLKDKKLVQIFDRYATYNGSSPYRASGILSMIPHLEQNVGTFFPKQGMRSIVDGLYRLAKEVGVLFEFNQEIVSCKAGSNRFEVYTQQENYTCKRLVCAIDHLHFYEQILKDKKLFKQYKKQERSSSALIFYWGMQQKFPKLGLHNIFFSEAYEQEFKLIFDKKEIPLKGTVYVHISSKANPKDAPENGENWFVMLNVPAGAVVDAAMQALVKKMILERLEMILKEPIGAHIECEKVWTPQGIEQDTGAVLGALYGASSNSKTAALNRHPNFSKRYRGLYFCGGTVHPGGGIPLALQSAKIVDKMLQKE